MAAAEMPEIVSNNITEEKSIPNDETGLTSAREFSTELQESQTHCELHVSPADDGKMPSQSREPQPAILPVSTMAVQTSETEPQIESQVSPAAVHIPPVQYLSPQEEARSYVESQASPTNATTEKSGEVKKTRRRGSAWTDDQTDFLMEVWARHTDSTGNEEYAITNAPIYRIISKSMGELGYLDKTSEQCKCRIHTLKRAYKLTKAEIDAGAHSITFCRHYEKLKIIMGDDPTTTPKQLAEILAKRRANKKFTGEGEAKPKKTKHVPEHKIKRALLTDAADKNQQGSLPKQLNKDNVQLPQLPPLPAVSSLWNNQSYTFPVAVPSPAQNLPAPVQNLTYQEPHYSAPLTNQSTNFSNTVERQEPPNVSYDINHNTNVLVKQEKEESDSYPVYQSFISKTSDAISQTKEEIERMRIDLEMKKIEMERNRLEMEERQRREDRDHQYRMMQLLLMGLGHNPGSGAPGQGSDNETAHQPELSRALEGGLVPGGAHSANEKGLSFSEI